MKKKDFSFYLYHKAVKKFYEYSNDFGNTLLNFILNDFLQNETRNLEPTQFSPVVSTIHFVPHTYHILWVVTKERETAVFLQTTQDKVVRTTKVTGMVMFVNRQQVSRVYSKDDKSELIKRAKDILTYSFPVQNSTEQPLFVYEKKKVDFPLFRHMKEKQKERHYKNSTLKAVFFKESGKWYATEEMEFDKATDWQILYDTIKEYFKNKYSDMTLVVTDFGDYEHTVPIMITPK